MAGAVPQAENQNRLAQFSRLQWVRSRRPCQRGKLDYGGNPSTAAYSYTFVSEDVERRLTGVVGLHLLTSAFPCLCRVSSFEHRGSVRSTCQPGFLCQLLRLRIASKRCTRFKVSFPPVMAEKRPEPTCIHHVHTMLHNVDCA